MKPTVAEAYIDRLKAACGVTSDDALAEKIGAGKSTIATWRRRGFVPDRVHQELSAKFKVTYPDVVHAVVADWLDDSTIGDTVLLILAMRLVSKIPETKLIEWSRWLANWRREILGEIARQAGPWDTDKRALIDHLLIILSTVTDDDRLFGANFLLRLRPKLDATASNPAGVLT